MGSRENSPDKSLNYFLVFASNPACLPNPLCRDDREREVARLWRRNHLSPGTLVIYLHWVHRFRKHCRQRGRDETAGD